MKRKKICVINNLARVRVFKVDADLHVMASVANFTIERSHHGTVPLSRFREPIVLHRAAFLGKCRDP
jgi:hypothetical protein